MNFFDLKCLKDEEQEDYCSKQKGKYRVDVYWHYVKDENNDKDNFSNFHIADTQEEVVDWLEWYKRQNEVSIDYVMRCEVKEIK